MARKSKELYYLDIATEVAKRGTCLRRVYGAVIVKDDEIIATGYNGAPRGSENCCDTGVCERQRLQVAAGERYELCKAVHAEANAIISAARRDMLGATLYLSGIDVASGEHIDSKPCLMCQRLIRNAGIIKIVQRSKDGEGFTKVDLRELAVLESLGIAVDGLDGENK